MKYFITFCILITIPVCASALTINEIMSNPIGDDGGREWIEIYNSLDTDADISSLTISIKGGAFLPVTPVSGATRIAPHGYAIISSTVAGVTKFTQDYGSYSGPLFKSTMSLVNTGVTSIELKSQGVTVDTIPSYSAVKEGMTYSLINGIFASGEPTPGEENKVAEVSQEATTSQNGTQVTIAQMSPPSADIILYLPQEKTVVAGAPSLFSVTSMTRSGKMIDTMIYTWSFGEGGQKTGSTTLYRYLYPGRYIIQVEGTNGLVAGTGRMSVHVVSPDIIVSPVGTGKYGTYIDITNPNMYDLDLSEWRLSLDGALFSFPRNTLVAHGTTRFTGVAMGFASTTIASSTTIKLMFSNMDEVVRVIQSETIPTTEMISIQKSEQSKLNTVVEKTFPKYSKIKDITLSSPHGVASFSSIVATGTKIILSQNKKDTRIASFLKALFFTK